MLRRITAVSIAMMALAAGAPAAVLPPAPIKPEEEAKILPPGCSKQFTQRKAISQARKVYNRPVVRKKAERRLKHMIKCAYSHDARRNLRKIFRELERRHDQRFTKGGILLPYKCGSHGYFAIPCPIIGCESEMVRTAVNSESGALGYYQIMPEWFIRLNRSRSLNSQHEIAAYIWKHGKGWKNWDCARKPHIYPAIASEIRV